MTRRCAMSALSALEAARQGYPALASVLVESATPVGVRRNADGLTAEQAAFLDEVYADGPHVPAYVVTVVTPNGIKGYQFEDWGPAMAKYLALVGMVAGQAVNGVPGFVELADHIFGDARRYGDEEEALRAYHNGCRPL
jgi:hypothetical protein